MQTAITRKHAAASSLVRRPAAMLTPRLGARRVTAAAGPDDKETPGGFGGSNPQTESERQTGTFGAESGPKVPGTPTPPAFRSQGTASGAPQTQPSVTDVLGFAGPAPEVINGRLAMLGFVAAAAAEIASGETVLSQWRIQPIGIVAAFILVVIASLVPIYRGAQGKRSSGPFSPIAEEFNGRIAMVGFAGLLLFEYFNNRPFF